MPASPEVAGSTLPQGNLDRYTSTPERDFLHPRLSRRAMQRIDHAVHAWGKFSEEINRSVYVLLPSDSTRFTTGANGKYEHGARERPVTARESCSIPVEIVRTFHVDARRSDWRGIAADQIQRFAESLLSLASTMRELDGSELSEE